MTPESKCEVLIPSEIIEPAGARARFDMVKCRETAALPLPDLLNFSFNLLFDISDFSLPLAGPQALESASCSRQFA